MGRIKIDADMLHSYSDTIGGRISEYEALTARMEQLNQSIQASWKGDAQFAFSNMMANYIAQAKQLQQILTQFQGYAQSTAEKFENLDLECAQRIRSSF